MPYVSMELLDLTCQAPKKSMYDTVKLYLALASETGDLDKLESNTEPTRDSINKGPYDFEAGKTFVFADSPPLGRQSWKTNNVSISEDSDVVLTLVGGGLYKSELGGGGHDSDSLAYKFQAFLRDNFLKLIPYVGSAIAAVIKYGQEAAMAEPDKECNGPLFVFSRTYSGADLIFSLLKDSYQTFSFEPQDSAPVTVHSDCRKPAYRASLLLRNGTVIRVDDSETRRPVSKSGSIVLTPTLQECKPAGKALFWVVRSESVIILKPSVAFTKLRYDWSMLSFGDVVSVADGGGEYAFQANVSRYNWQTGRHATATETVKLRGTVLGDGSLEIRVPETAGNFRFQVNCGLRHGDQHVHLESMSLNVTSETVDGNQEYHDYIECQRAWWARQKAIVDQFSEHLKQMPQLVPHYDPVFFGKPFEKLSASVSQVIKDAKKVLPKRLK